MKRFFFIIAIAISCFATYSQEFAKEETENKNIAFESSASEDQYTFSSAIDIFNHAANKDNGQHAIQRLFPTFHKFSVISNLPVTKTGLQKASRITLYIAYAENQKVRFEGIDIIHPFDYFW